MSGAEGALLAGLLAGYGIAMPLGAIGVLIVHEGLTRGWHSAAAAASGTALVDLGYAALALAAGSAVTQRLQGHERVIELAGAAVLVAVVARGVLALRRTALPVTTDALPRNTLPQNTAAADAVATATLARTAPLHTLRRFVALTAINPLTAVYFVVLTTTLGDTVHGDWAAVAFAVGVFVSSWSWQLMLAAVGTLAGTRLPDWARTATSLAGYLVVLGYAVHLAAG
jgi:arginine exporter protein ArgO